MKRRQVPIDPLDESRVHRRWHVRAVKRRFERAVVLPGAREEDVGLDLAVERRAKRCAELAQRAEELRHDLLTILAVRHGAIKAEARAVELDGLAVAQCRGRVREVGVRKDPVGARRGARDDPRAREQPLFGVSQGVRRPALDVVEVEPVGLESRLGGDELVDDGLVELQDFRFDERGFGAEHRSELDHLLLHPLVLAHARVGVRHHARVDVGARELLRKPRAELERVGQARGRRAERPLEFLDFRNLGDELVFCAPPGLV